MRELHIIGEIHDDKSDVEYKSKVEKAAKADQLIYIKEGTYFGDFDKDGDVYTKYPNILGLEDVYIFALTNCLLISAFSSNISQKSKLYLMTLFARKGLASPETKKIAEKYLEKLEPDFEENKKIYSKERLIISNYIKTIAQLLAEIYLIKNNPIKELFTSINNIEIVKEYARKQYLSKMKEAISTRDSLYNYTELDTDLVLEYVKDKDKWLIIFKELAFKLADKISQHPNYQDSQQYISKEFIESVFNISEATAKTIHPIALYLRNKSYSINIRLLLDDNVIRDSNKPIYAIMGDGHIKDLQTLLGSTYRNVKIYYYPLKLGRDKRPNISTIENFLKIRP